MKVESIVEPPRRHWLRPFLRLLWSVGFSIAALAGAEARDAQWWLEPRRMIQTNLREIDSQVDLDAYIAALTEFKANVVLLNVGGIVANYPTALPYHYRNPFLKGDFVGEVARRLHAANIRVIGRFDFSKVNQELAARHPEWLSRDAQGRAYPAYNGQVPTCLNGGYQQEAMFQILGEAIDRYPLDGVFFNMIGYPRSDYSGRQLGVCQCDGCRTRFRARCGLELPLQPAAGDVAWTRYEEFCQLTIREQFERVNRLVKARNPHIAICTYTGAGVDVLRKESNTPQVVWAYEDSQKARLTLLEHPGKQLANAAVHFIHYPQRHSAVSPWLTQRRLLQQMVNGAWLDFYCIGPLHTLEDRLGLAQLRDIFRFHAEHEPWLRQTREAADVALAVGADRNHPEFRGLFKILSESQVSFQLVALENLDALSTPNPPGWPSLILPVLEPLSQTVAAGLDEFVARGGRLLLTGCVPPPLKCLGVRATGEVLPQTQGTYLRIRPSDKRRLQQPALDLMELVYLDGRLWTGETEPDVERLLGFIPAAMFGPPEKCYYTNETQIPALLWRRHGEGSVAWFPWNLGSHYDKQGHPGHAALLVGSLDSLLTVPRRVRVTGPALVEMNHRAGSNGQFEWVSLLNLSGQLDKVLHAPVPIRDVALSIRPQRPVKSAVLLKAGKRLKYKTGRGGEVACVVPEVNDYEIVLFKY